MAITIRRTHDGKDMLVPYPLDHEIVRPTLNEWTRVEPACAEPYYWLNGYANLKRALELDSKHEPARKKLIWWILNDVDFATHESPTGFIGDPIASMRALEEAETLMGGLANSHSKAELADWMKEQRSLVDGYLRSRHEGA